MIENIKKLAIHGKAKTGKSTVAKLIHQNFQDDVFETAFANPIKNLLRDLFGCNYEDLFGSSEKRQKLFLNNLTYRDMLQDFGELAKKYNPNIWIEKTEQNIISNLSRITFKQPKDIVINQNTLYLNTMFIPNDYKLILITDLRFKTEYDWLKSKNFKLLKLKRSNNDYSSNHISETELDSMADNSFDFHMDNDGTIDDLARKVRDLISSL